jgi:uncharacterized membrane protein
MLLECVALLAGGEEQITCRIIGDGPERRALIQQAKRLGLEHLVDFRRGVSTADLLPLVKAGRVFVFPSEREGFGIAALEAIACGLPVITTSAEHNQARHLVTRSARGVVCEPNAPALAVAVRSALARQGVAGPPRRFEDPWVREYDWETVAAKVALALKPAAVEGGSADPRARATPRSPARIQAAAAPPIAGGSGHALTAAGGSPGGTSVAEPTPAKFVVTESQARRRRPAPPLPDLIVSIVGVLALGGLAQVRGAWIAQAAELLLLLTVPGFALLRAARVRAEAVRGFPLYIPCASIAVIMAAGLSVDLIGPELGVARPLRTVPLAVTICALCAALIVVGLWRPTPSLVSDVRDLKLWRAWPLLLPVAAWIGAMRLSHGHGPAVAIATVTATGVALMVGVWRLKHWTRAQILLLIFGSALALMWGFTLRGHFVYGFDITGEYQTFLHVVRAGRWHASHPNDAYGAMLSLTIFPSTLVAMTGASPLLVLKAIFPFLFALFPVGVYLLAERVLARRFAYLGVLFILVQAYFFQQLPAIARQEIALLFFVCLVFAMLDLRLARNSRIVLLAVFGIGLVLSHYGTAYLTIAVLATALILELARRRLLPRMGSTALAPLAITVAILSVGSAIWYQPVTDSAQNLSQFFSDVRNQGLAPLPDASGSVLHAYLAGNVATRISGARFTTLAHNDYAKKRPYVHPLPQAYERSFGLRDAAVPGARVRSHPAVRALDAEQVLVAELANVLAAIGALILWLRRRGDPTSRTVAVLGVATLLFLVVVRMSGTASNDYNQERAFLQAMVPLAICMAWTLQRGSRYGRAGRTLAGAFAVALGLTFLTTSSLRGPLVGGGTLTNLANQGEDYERYYVSAPEIAAARWVNDAAPPGEIVSADRYGALRLLGATNRVDAVLPDLTPPTIDRHAWIYADTANFVGHRARGAEGSQYALYAWPDFIGEFWNLVYTNGSAGVYARTH